MVSIQRLLSGSSVRIIFGYVLVFFMISVVVWSQSGYFGLSTKKKKEDVELSPPAVVQRNDFQESNTKEIHPDLIKEQNSANFTKKADMDGCMCECDYIYTSPCEYTVALDAKERAERRKLARANPKCAKLKTCQEIPEEFKPKIEMKYIKMYLDMIEAFTTALENAGLVYWMHAGTLLGSLRHHGFIPYDDDFDVFLNYSQKEEIKKALFPLEPMFVLRFPVLGRGIHKGPKWKFYAEDGIQIPNKPHKWPYIDPVLFKEDDKVTYNINKFYAKKHTFKKSDTFPLQKRPFCHLWLNSPLNHDENLRLSLGDVNGKCAGRIYNHREEHSETGKMKSSIVKCTDFLGKYPTVTKVQKFENGTKETLTLGNKIMQELFVPHQDPSKIHAQT